MRPTSEDTAPIATASLSVPRKDRETSCADFLPTDPSVDPDPCFAAGDCSAAQTCVEYEYSGSSVVDACVDYSGFRIRGGGKQGFLEHNINGQWLPSCASFGPTSAFIVADLVCSDLFGTSGYAEERDAATMSRYYPLADCPEGATSFDDCSVVLDYSCTFDDFVYVMCN